MSYTVAVSRTPCVLNVLRNHKGRPIRHRTLVEAHWRAWLALQDLSPGRYVEVRKGGEVVERMVQSMILEKPHRWVKKKPAKG